MRVLSRQRRTVALPGGDLGYTLERKPVRSLRLRVRRDGSVAVSAPPGVPVAAVDGFVVTHGPWIEGARRRLAETAPVPFRWGGPVTLWGRLYTLHRAPAGAPPRLEGGALHLPGREDPTPAVERFLAAQREEALARALLRHMAAIAALGARQPVFRWRAMKASWGRCHPRRGDIVLNKSLVHRPEACFDYVVAHELAHLVYPDHSAAFYRCLAARVPDYKALRARLSQGR